MKTAPQDQTQRDRFATELDKNFSVIAAAGAGKTTAITDRIVHIAKDPKRACEWFSRLVVVTFTNRAADEMQQRARQRIFESNVSPDVLAAFNRAFFGTIHSFCMKLLAAQGHHLGLPARLELITDDEELWNEFVQRTHSVGHSLSPENRDALFRHVQLRDLMELGRRGRLPLSLQRRETRYPGKLDLSLLHNHSAPKNATRVQALQKALHAWEQRINRDTDFLPLIECTVEGKFAEKWENTFREFNEWLSCCAMIVAAEIQASYRQFRAERGVVTFDDQIALALALTRNHAAVSRIRAKDYVVILDEAQDTDPQQFEILLEITRPTGAPDGWLDNLKEPPRPGRFCMVGDFQQSIYGDRADLRQYLRFHDALTKSGAGEALEFSVTFRLDCEQVDFINSTFREILNGDGDQVDFIQLNPRPDALPGQVIRLDIAAEQVEPKAPENNKAKAEATRLAQWILKTGCENLRARSWEQVAVLCPRKKWFAPIADALRLVAIDSQIQSETDVMGDSPAHAWFTALLTIMTQPRSGFEIAGVLREIFGVSDHDLALFADGNGDRFQIETPTAEGDAVSTSLDLLARIHAEIADKPLFTAVRRIVDGTFLRQRLQQLPDTDFDDLDTELDVLLESAATAEAEGATLEELAELLRANFATEREARTPRTGAVQLITCQKAKGLEWDAVVVPFFSRRIHTDDDNFPRFVTAGRDCEVMVAFSKGDVPTERKDAIKKAQGQEMERLLYVALTRARHTLVLAGDRELFAKSDGTASRTSLTKWFRADRDQPNEPHVAKLDANAIGCAKTQSHQSTKARPDAESKQFPPLAEALLPRARERAQRFPEKFLPSSLTPARPAIESTGADKWKETEPEFRAATVPSVATQYGIWWHEFVQGLHWKADPAAWDKIFEHAHPGSPDKGRSLKEWDALRRNIPNLSGLKPDIRDPAVIVRVEMPFLWATNDRRCLEGVIDLALFDPGKKNWLLLDWKTNDIAPDRVQKLRAYYLPQLTAYWKAIGEITKMDVAVAIYSTATGELVRYETDELAQEWMRLERLPAKKFERALIRNIDHRADGRTTQLELPGL
jgi:ATP-dependent exoDNAse (exonuclease V) beta subunit